MILTSPSSILLMLVICNAQTNYMNTCNRGVYNCTKRNGTTLIPCL